MFASGKTAAVASAANYIEDVFSTYLYTGIFSYLNIPNGIDLLNKGGMVWTKSRTNSGTAARNNHFIIDSARGWTGSTGQYLNSNTTAAQSATEVAFMDPLANGYDLGQARYANDLSLTYASWTFRKQPKFFDVVTYTGNGTAGRTVAHSLGSVPGCMIVRPTSAVDDWFVYHRSLLNSQSLFLNLTTAASNTPSAWNSTTPTSTEFTVGTNTATNANGVSYVAYLFAHDAGGFGLTGTDNVISCGSYVGNGSTPNNVTLGYEPQWIMIKDTTGSTNPWVVVDNMRGMSLTNRVELYPNTSGAELTSATNRLSPTATGFFLNGDNSFYNTNGSTYIYIAIRRGPMKVPTSGTSVFAPVAYTGNGTTNALTGIGFPPDLMITKGRSAGSANEGVTRDRLRGTNPALRTTTTNAESSTTTNGLLSYDMGGVTLGADNTGTDVNGQTNTSGNTYVNWLFRRAPSYFDEVCYTGTGTSTAFNHNLTVVPEMIITKIRNSAVPNWGVWHNALSPSSAMLFLNTTGTQGNGYVDTVTSTTFSFATANGVVNSSGNTYVAYLFASCAGVSKVGSYTGTGTTKQVDCGFTGGARFVLIKRTDSTGAWYVWDSARGIVAGNDPYLLLNSTAAEVTNTDYVDTYSAGFEISSTAPAAINASGGTFIFLAIA